MLINIDLCQIEMVWFAQLSKDKLLIKLINDGTDLHRYTASLILDKPEISAQERQDAKTANFGIIYGNGPKTLSENTGRSFDWCKNYIEEFYNMFHEAKSWHDSILSTVKQTSNLKLFTNEVLYFRKYPAKYDWQFQQGITESYNPPEIKNYPVQHIAGLTMKMIIAEFARKKAFMKRDKYLLINTVHDSLMIDAKEEYSDEAISDFNEVLDSIPSIIYNVFNERMLVPIKCDISMGACWHDL